jgi:hypothetical protein
MNESPPSSPLPRDDRLPLPRTSLVWKRPAPLAQVELVRGFGGVAAPLLAGFSLTSIAFLLTTRTTLPEADWVIAAFTLAAASLLSSMRYSFLVLRHSASPAERLGWFPEATIDSVSLDLERQNQAEDMTIAQYYSGIAETLYDLGRLAFLAGLTLLLVPLHWDKARVVAFAVALAAGGVEVVLLAGDLLDKSPRYLTLDRGRIRDSVKRRLSMLDDVSHRSVLRDKGNWQVDQPSETLNREGRMEEGRMADDKVQWPSQAVSQLDDLAAPTKTLLTDLHLLGEEDQAVNVGPFQGTPYSLQVITSGASALNKVWSSLVGTAGFGSAVAVFVAAIKQQEVPVKAALAGAAGVVLAATAVAIAVIVSSDVRARAAAAGEQYQARAAVAAVFLRTAASERSQPPQAQSAAGPPDSPLGQAVLALAPSGHLRVITLEGEVPVTGIHTDEAGALKLAIRGGGEVAAVDVKGLKFALP